MAIENYVNTGSMDPYSGWRPEGALAGYMYQDKVGDYNTARNIQNDAGLLSNLQQKQTTDTYAQNSPVRDAERNLQLGAIGQQQQLQPGDTQLKMGAQASDIAAQPFQNEEKIWNAASKLPAEKRAAQLKEITTAGSILKGMPQDAAPQDQIDMLRNSGVDTSRWNGKSPDQVSKELGFIRNLDPDFFKHQREMELAGVNNKNKTDVANIQANGRISVAKMRADTMRDISSGKMNEQQLFDKFNEISAKPEEERTPKEQQLVDNYWDYKSAAAQVKDQAAAKKPADTIQELENMKKRQDAFTTDPSIPKGAKLGPYDTKKKKYEVQDKDGHVMGWF